MVVNVRPMQEQHEKVFPRHVHDSFLAFGSMWFEIRVPYSASLHRIPQARQRPKALGAKPQNQETRKAPQTATSRPAKGPVVFPSPRALAVPALSAARLLSCDEIWEVLIL